MLLLFSSVARCCSAEIASMKLPFSSPSLPAAFWVNFQYFEKSSVFSLRNSLYPLEKVQVFGNEY